MSEEVPWFREVIEYDPENGIPFRVHSIPTEWAERVFPIVHDMITEARGRYAAPAERMCLDVTKGRVRLRVHGLDSLTRDIPTA